MLGFFFYKITPPEALLFCWACLHPGLPPSLASPVFPVVLGVCGTSTASSHPALHPPAVGWLGSRGPCAAILRVRYGHSAARSSRYGRCRRMTRALVFCFFGPVALFNGPCYYSAWFWCPPLLFLGPPGCFFPLGLHVSRVRVRVNPCASEWHF